MPFPFGGQSIESLLFTVSVLVWVISEGVRGVRTRTDAATNDRYSLMLLRVCITGGMVLAAFATRIFATAFFRTPLVFGVSIGLVWAGVGLRWWCFQTLG